MADLLQSRWVTCPYCGEQIELLIDSSIAEQQYIEDCQVCCQPINIEVWVDPQGDAQVMARHQDEC
ncbi:MAG: CPXCG motif-containing cysteine-rich protein [Chromatiales bacterium]|jgi:hypothetical protein